MLHSMTGFGLGEAEGIFGALKVEIRSLNSKSLDIGSLRLPSRYRNFEPEIRSAITNRLKRGKVEVYVALSRSGSYTTERLQINGALFAEGLVAIQRVCEEACTSYSEDATISSILRLPEVWITEEQPLIDEERKAFADALGQALEAIVNFRETEGRALASDLRAQVEDIKRCLDGVEQMKEERAARMKDRFCEALEAARDADTPPVDEARLAQEILYHLERLDINEEISRLSQHCRYFIDTMDGELSQGRKLSFIAQEMGREINTIGSKANHVGIQRHVVDMKDSLERIKEQLLNVL